MRYQIVNSYLSVNGNWKYTIDLDLNEGETLHKEVLLQDLDYPNGAPFGGNVELLANGLIGVEVYRN